MINEIKTGKVFQYNGESGYIVTDDMQYPFAKKDVYSEIENGDIVTFIPNIVIFGDEKTYVAKFIRKYQLENVKIKANINDKIES